MYVNNLDDLTRSLIDLIVAIILVLVIDICFCNLGLVVTISSHHSLKVLVGSVRVNQFVSVEIITHKWPSLTSYCIKKREFRICESFVLHLSAGDTYSEEAHSSHPLKALSFSGYFAETGLELQTYSSSTP